MPFGVLGAIWSYLKLQERGIRRPARLDWAGNLTFGAGLIAVLVGITYGIQPYGGHTMGWTSPMVLTLIGAGLVTLVIFCIVETRAAEPMFHLALFRIRPFTAGNMASLLAGLGRGGLMFTLIIWLQGIYLPIHGYGFSQTPLWAGIAMIPLTIGFLIAGPASGWLSDRYGARPFATGGMVLAAASFVLLELLPIDFAYWQFAVILLLNGVGMGLFASPNRAGIMNSLPPERRGVGAGMSATFQNSAMVLSIGIFFTLIILGLASSLPAALDHGLIAQGLPALTRRGLPPCRRSRSCLPPCSATTQCRRCSGPPSANCQRATRLTSPATPSSRRSSRRRSSTGWQSHSTLLPQPAWLLPWRPCCGAEGTCTSCIRCQPRQPHRTPTAPSGRWREHGQADAATEEAIRREADAAPASAAQHPGQPLAELRRRRCPDLAPDLLSSSQHQQRRDRLNTEAPLQPRGLVDVDLDQLQPAGHFGGESPVRDSPSGTGRTTAPTGRQGPEPWLSRRSVANVASPASTIHGSGRWQSPQRGVPAAAAGTRFLRPQFGQRITVP